VEISDRAGNISTTAATYFVDNVVPNAPVQDVNFWGKLTAFDRRVLDQKVLSDPNDPNSPVTNPTGLPSNMQPANNRLLEIDNQQNYVIKDNSVVFYGMAEKGTYPILSVNNADVVAMETDLVTCTTQSFVDGVLVDNHSSTAPDGSIVQDKNHCLWKIEVGFEALYNTLKDKNALNTTSQGTKPGASSKAEGVYLIQWRDEDPSGNRSEYTRQYLLEYDKTKPQFFSVDKASSPKFNPIVDWQSNGNPTFYNDGRGNLPPVTNQISLTLDSTTEQLADVEYYLIDNSGQVVSNQYQKFINARNQKHTISFTLGDKTADQNGQSGFVQDGYYQICYNSGDSADNEIGLKCFAIERDTLTPQAPNFSANLNFVYKQEPYTISGVVSGEQYTKSSLLGNLGRSGTKSGTLKTLSVDNDSDWETTFTFCSNLSDRATNTSGNTCRSVQTPVRPPRSGECVMSDGATDYIKDQIQNGAKDKDGKLINPLDPNQVGLGKSCQVYEPDLVNKLISEEANKIVDELNAAATEEQQKLQDKYNEEIKDDASCIQTKLADYAKNKGSGNASSTQLDTWMKECGANSDLLNVQVGEEGKTQSFADAIKSSIEGINNSYNRGTPEGCQWFSKWPWEKGSCIREGVAEAVFYIGEGLGHIAAILVTPSLAISGAVKSLIDGSSITDNIQNGYKDVQNGFSNGARAVINGIGTVVGAVINLAANIENLKLSVIQTGIGCITGQPCSIDQIGNNYDNNHQALKDKLGWDTGDWKQNAAIVATTAVVVAASMVTFGAAGVVAAGAVGLVAGNALAYAVGSVINGGPLDPKEFFCGNKDANATECTAYQAGQLVTGAIIGKAVGAVIPKPAKTVVGEVTKKLEDGGLKSGVGAVDDLKNKLGKPGTANPADDIDSITGKKKIPCYSSLDKPNHTPLDYAVAFLFGGVRAEACGEDQITGTVATETAKKIGYAKTNY